MAGSIRVVSNLRASGPNNLLFQSPIPAWSDTFVTGGSGPTPGSLLVPTDPGVEINISEVSIPGYANFINYDEENWVTVGIYDPATGEFYPFLEIGPGQAPVLKLSRHLGEKYHNTGTGAAGPQLWAKADTAACQCAFLVFQQ
jgi:hypothetical protein